MSADADPIAAAVAYLGADNEVTPEVPAASIFGAELPSDQPATMPKKAVVVQPSGGGSGPGDDGYLRLGVQRLDVNSYGSTPFEARRVARAVHRSLKRLQRKVVSYVDDTGATVKVLLHSANVSGGYIGLREPDTDWPRVLRSYVLLYAEELVP